MMGMISCTEGYYVVIGRDERGWDMPETMEKPAMRIRFARMELPDNDYQRLKRSADRYHISVAGYIRLAVMERIEADESK